MTEASFSPTSTTSNTEKEKLIDTNAAISNTANNEAASENIQVSEDILNVIQSGQVKTSTSNKLSLLMDSSSDEDEGEYDEENLKQQQQQQKQNKLKKPVSKKLTLSTSTTAGKRIYSKDTDYSEEELDENGLLSDGYDINLFGDATDKAALEAMTEIEREAILYERAQLRQARQERRALEQKIREQEEMVSGKRAPTRAADIKRKKLDELKEKRQKKQLSRGARESEEEEGEFDDEDLDGEEDESEEERERERGQRQRQRQQKSRKTRRQRRSEESDEDYYTEESEEESYKKSSKKSAAAAIKRKGAEDDYVEVDEDEDSGTVATTDSAPLDLDCVNKLRLSRDILAEWVYRDGFEDIVQKCFLRINLGPGKNGQPTYRLVELKKIVDFHHTYLIKAGFPTNLAALVKFARSERTFRFEFVSNSPFTDAEFQHWKYECERAGVKLPYNSVTAAKRKIDKLKAFYQQPLTDSIVALMLERKKKLQAAQSAPRNLLAEQTILQQQLREAHELSNDEEVTRIEAELAAISQRKEHISANRREDRLAVMEDLNRRNRLLNLETGRQAEISRMQLESSLLLEAQNSNSSSTKNNTQNGNVKTLDPFQRRKCKPTVIHLNDESSVAETTALKEEVEIAKVDPDTADSLHSSSNGGDAKNKAPPPAKSLYDAHDFDLDLDI